MAGVDYWSLLEPYWDGVSIHDGAEAFSMAFAKLPPASQHLFAAHWLQSEVCNGGFSQFFGNGTGVLAPEAVTGYLAIGMPRASTLVQAAMARLGEPYPRDRARRIDLLGVFEKLHGARLGDVGDLDEQFYDCMDNENGGFDLAADSYATLNKK